jgi:hypothetical protein
MDSAVRNPGVPPGRASHAAEYDDCAPGPVTVRAQAYSSEVRKLLDFVLLELHLEGWAVGRRISPTL